MIHLDLAGKLMLEFEASSCQEPTNLLSGSIFFFVNQRTEC